MRLPQALSRILLPPKPLGERCSAKEAVCPLKDEPLMNLIVIQHRAELTADKARAGKLRVAIRRGEFDHF